MPKPRHANAHAERRIVELDLPRWRSRRELAAEAKAIAEHERAEAEQARLVAVAAERAAEARALRRKADRARARAGDSPERRRRAVELEADVRAAERVARCAALLVPVPWSELSPAELAFRWMLAHHHCEGEPNDYARWAHGVREAWKAERGIVAHDGVSQAQRAGLPRCVDAAGALNV